MASCRFDPDEEGGAGELCTISETQLCQIGIH